LKSQLVNKVVPGTPGVKMAKIDKKWQKPTGSTQNTPLSAKYA
jgi:hypothetical protein